jgi:hypothetical protein
LEERRELPSDEISQSLSNETTNDNIRTPLALARVTEQKEVGSRTVASNEYRTTVAVEKIMVSSSSGGGLDAGLSTLGKTIFVTGAYGWIP